jgi:polar amino acid transport system substrate-binding protein
VSKSRMLKSLLLLCLLGAAVVVAACGSDSTDSTSADSTGTTSLADCTPDTLETLKSGTLTIGTDKPAYPPYFEDNDPSNGKGFESAVAYAIADQLGFSQDQVEWTVVPFNSSYAPGPKDFDFDINQISYSNKRAGTVDFSESYYDVNQALVIVKGTPIESATSVSDLAQYKLAAPLGTTSSDLIANYIGGTPGTFQTLRDAVAAVNAGQADGLVVDYPTALFMADPYVQQVKNSTVLAQFPNDAVEGGEYFGTVQAKDSDLTPCIDLALQEMKADDSLASITDTWLSKKTNVGEVPVWSK